MEFEGILCFSEATAANEISSDSFFLSFRYEIQFSGNHV